MLTSAAREKLLHTLSQCVESDADAQVIQRALNALEPALRMYDIDLLSTAAAELTEQIPAGSIELHIIDGEPTLRANTTFTPDTEQPPQATAVIDDSSDSTPTARLTLRLPEHLKERVDKAAQTAGTSVNSWVTTALTNALQTHTTRNNPHNSRGRITGWIK